MKKVFFRVASAMLLLAFLLPLVSCGGANKGDVETTGAIPKDIVIDVTKYICIRPVDCSTALREAASDLRDRFVDALQKRVNLKSDTLVEQSAEVPEILIGLTNRQESIEAHAKLAAGEYTIALLENGTLVIVGYDEWATIRAVTAFMNTYLPYDRTEHAYLVNTLVVPENLNLTVSLFDQSNFKLGLQVRDDGTILLGGEEFQAIGVNWHGGFWEHTRSGVDLDAYFRVLRDNGIPYVRTMFGAFYAQDWSEWQNNRTRYYEAMDRFVEKAEEYQIGIIGSLIWDLYSVPQYCNEPYSAIADPNSKSVQFACAYVTEIIQRYYDSPAIWGWEIGNEGNLGADVGEIRTAWLNKYYSYVGAAMAAADPNRLLTAGDSYPRAPSKALRETGQWYPNDTREDVKETFSLYTPAPLNCISVHIYAARGSDGYINDCISDLRAKARELGIGAFVGEFGQGDYGFENPRDVIGADDPREAEEQRVWRAMVDLFLESDVQVLCAWSFGRYAMQSSDGTSIEYGMYNGVYQNAYQIDYIREKNATLREQNNNLIERYWNSVNS